MEVPHDTTISYYHFRMKHETSMLETDQLQAKRLRATPPFFPGFKAYYLHLPNIPNMATLPWAWKSTFRKCAMPFFQCQRVRGCWRELSSPMVAQCSSRFSHVYWWSRGTDAVSWAQSVEPRWTAPTTAPREMASEHHVAASGDGGEFSP